MKFSTVIIGAVALVLVFSFVITLFGPVQPLGRLSFVKLENPDMYPGHPHSELLAKYAVEHNSKCALVVHFAGSSTYSSYLEDGVNSTTDPDGVYIIEVAFIDTQGGGSTSLNQTNFLDSLKVALFGVPDGRYKYMSDGVVYNTYDDMMKHVQKVAKQHGQEGPIPMAWNCTYRQSSYSSRMWFPTLFQNINKNLWNNPCLYILYHRINLPLSGKSIREL